MKHMCNGDCFNCVYGDCIVPVATDKTIERMTGRKIKYYLLRNKGKREYNGLYRKNSTVRRNNSI